MLKRFFAAAVCMAATCCAAAANGHTVWNIGEADRRADGFALAPAGFRDFIANDFGYEDKFFLVGWSSPDRDFPYTLPGPADTWGGTWSTAGCRIPAFCAGSGHGFAEEARADGAGDGHIVPDRGLQHGHPLQHKGPSGARGAEKRRQPDLHLRAGGVVDTV